MVEDDAPYRGPDRRAQAGDPGRDRSWVLVAGIVALLLAVALGPALQPLTDATGPKSPTAIRVAVLLLALGVVTTALFHWRATGVVAGAWVAASSIVLGAAVLLEVLLGEAVAAASAAGISAVAGAHLIVASASPEIDAGVSPRTVVPWGLAAGLLAGSLAFAARGGGADFVVTLAAATWFTAAVSGGARAWRGTSVLLGWTAVAATVLALAELASLREVRVVLPDVIEPLMQGLGLLVMSAGVTFELARSVDRHRYDVLDRELVRQAVEERRRVVAEDRSHDLGNALMALEGATLTLARLRDRLAPDQQTALAEAVVRGAAEVRRLTVAEASQAAPTSLELREVVDHQVTLLRASGLAVVVTGVDRVWVEVVDGDVQQILQNLLANARHHGGANEQQPVRVDVGRRGGLAAVRVTDAGPGIPAWARSAIFERGVQATGDPTGQGLGLTVARGLAQRNGGDLRLVPTPTGACFELTFPIADVSSGR